MNIWIRPSEPADYEAIWQILQHTNAGGGSLPEKVNPAKARTSPMPGQILTESHSLGGVRHPLGGRRFLRNKNF